MQQEIESLKEQVSKITEEKTMAIAETKQQNHKTILEKDNEVTKVLHRLILNYVNCVYILSNWKIQFRL